MTVIAETNQDQLRKSVLEASKKHKASWIQLGQYLFAIYKEKMFKNWGFQTFEGYCLKELHIKQTTAGKLLKSYYFLEREEPRLARPEFVEEEADQKVPDYESVNLLRLAKENKKIAPKDFAQLREAVLEKVKEPKEIRAQVKKVLEQSDPKDPDQVQKNKRNSMVKRIITLLAQCKIEMVKEKLVPAYLIKQMDDLAEKLKDQVE